MNDNTSLEPVPVAAHDDLLALFHAARVVAFGRRTRSTSSTA
jgi:hypothetical protein